MGCGTSSVPDEIIPDPEPGEKCEVLFKKTGFMSRDQNVFKDKDKSKKWLLMDKEGGLFSNPTYVLENFVRKEGSKKGECLCAAKLELCELKKYGRETHEDSDSSSDDSSDDQGEELRIVTKLKWAQKIKIKLYSDRGMDKKIAEVKVKAKGKAKKTVTIKKWTKDVKDAEGNVTGQEDKESRSTEIEKKVKKLKYVIEELDGEDEPPKIELKGKPNKSAFKLEWHSAVFEAEIESSNWGSDEIEVKTSYKNPALGMLMGYIIAKDVSPNDIKDNIHVF